MPGSTATTAHAFEHPASTLAYIHLVYSGDDPRLSNFLGMYGIPSPGGWYWWAIDGDHGEAETEAECQREVLNAWNGTGGTG